MDVPSCVFSSGFKFVFKGRALISDSDDETVLCLCFYFHVCHYTEGNSWVKSRRMT